MALAQALPAAEEEAASKIVIIPSAEKTNGHCPEVREATDFMCAKNCEDNGFYREPSCEQRKVGDADDQDIDVLGCEGGGVSELMKGEDPDATEHSSSFGGTFSGSSDGSKLDPDDTEVDSKLNAKNRDSSSINWYNRVFKKKKVTDHWRKFIHPLMWRCHWLELRMKQLNSQASTYDKELEAYKNDKLLHAKVVELDDSASRLVPLTCRSHIKPAMRRQKRRRSEDTVDIASYMSNHNIFSYYENKRPETDCHSVDDGCDDQVDEDIHDDLEWSLFHFRLRRDSYLEQLLLDIESVMSRADDLRAKHNLSGTSSTPANGDGMQVDALDIPTHHFSEYEMEDTALPGSSVSSFGDAADLDMIDSTLGLFIASDIPLDEHDIGNFCEDIDDDVLISNPAAEEELQDFEKVGHAVEKPQVTSNEEAESSEEASTTPMASKTEQCSEEEKVDTMQQPALKPCYTGKRRGRKPKKRRRGGFAARVQKQ